MNWFTNRALESFSSAEQQRKLLRVLIAAIIACFTFFRAGRTLQSLLKVLNHPPALTYLATLGLLCVLTIRDTGIRTGWTFIEDERYYLFLYPAFAIETGIAFLAVVHGFESRQRYRTAFIFAATASSVLTIRYCHGVWRDSLQSDSSLYHFLAREDSLPPRTIVLGNEQELRHFRLKPIRTITSSSNHCFRKHLSSEITPQKSLQPDYLGTDSPRR